MKYKYHLGTWSPIIDNVSISLDYMHKKQNCKKVSIISIDNKSYSLYKANNNWNNVFTLWVVWKELYNHGSNGILL